MFAIKRLAVLFVGALLLGAGIHAAAADSKPASGKAMNMDESMPIKMAKPGMKKGDVKTAAEKKEAEMKPMLEREAAGAAKK